MTRNQKLGNIIKMLSRKNHPIAKLELKFIEELQNLEGRELSNDDQYDDLSNEEYFEMLADHVLWDLEVLGQIAKWVKSYFKGDS